MIFGGEIVLSARSWQRLFRFGAYATVAALSPASYGAAAREIAVRRIYRTACMILPGYLLFSAVLGVVIIGIVQSMARSNGLSEFALELVLRVLVLELVPLLTALFVALRTGAVLGIEIALMRVNGELEDHYQAGASPLHGELVPRIAAAALSVFSLTALGVALAMCLAYALSYGDSAAGFGVYTRVVGHIFGLQILVGLLLKCLVFGIAVALIPLATGLEAERGRLETIPAAVLAGLMKLFFLIGVIEVLSLTVKYV